MCRKCGHDTVAHLIAWPLYRFCLVYKCACGATDTGEIIAILVVLASAIYLAARIIF